MKPYTLHQGDALETLRTMPDEYVQTCVTSPPYFGLRDYGTAEWQGGDAECDHKPEVKPRTERARNGLTGGMDYMAAQEPTYKDVCAKCGAKRIDSQIGLEGTPDAYVERLVEVFREVKRVLRDDGVLFLNLGDSYAAGGGTGKQRLDQLGERMGTGGGHKHSSRECGRAPTPKGLKPKDLIGIPWRTAFALQADGWWLRSDIIWHKPNCMPSSVTDRPTTAHEYIFLLSKNASYFYDHEAIREEAATDWANREGGLLNKTGWASAAGRNDDTRKAGTQADSATRNKRSVWTVATRNFSEAHFATFPPDLIRPCILAGAPEGGVVLDPFSGASTTGLVALQHRRRYIGIELNPEYIELSRRRLDPIAAQPSIFAESFPGETESAEYAESR